MSNQPSHPDRELFEYLRGGLDPSGRDMVEAHIAECADCKEVAGVVRALRQGGPDPDRASAWLEPRSGHPDISELATLFYGGAEASDVSQTAAHVAVCPDCREEIATYARAESAADSFDSRAAERVAFPDAAWEMIREWEDSSFAKTKPETKSLSPELAADDSADREQSKEARPNEPADLKQNYNK